MTLICSNWAHVRASFSFAATRHKEALLVPRSHSGACSEAPRVIYLHVSCIGYVYVCMYLCIIFPLLIYVSRIEYVYVSIVYVHTLLGTPCSSSQVAVQWSTMLSVVRPRVHSSSGILQLQLIRLLLLPLMLPMQCALKRHATGTMCSEAPC